jgi:cyclic beta-1,2-glucan synthetase
LLVASVTLGIGNVFTQLAGYLTLGAPAVAGALVGWLAVRTFGLGVDDALVEMYARRLVAGETVVIVQAPPASLGRALRYLRTAGGSQPSIFALHPPRVPAAGAELDKGEPLTAAQLAAHARHLASGHQFRSYTGRDESLLKQLDFCEAAIERGRRELAEASHLEKRISTSAEWILDNAHLIKAHIDDVRLNLPRKFYRELPILTTSPHRGKPRIYAVASDLIAHTDGQFDRHIIADYLDAYQSIAVLTIGELWAAPLMLRIALIDRIGRLTDQVTERLRDRECADFWANRLLAAARRDRSQLFTFLAELARELPEPSEHFAFHLTEHLYNEDAALIPVQSWLEHKLTSALADGVLLEQARHAAGQASIAAAITSLRQLSLLDWREIFEDQSRVDQTLCRDPAGYYSRMDFPTRDRYRHAVEELARGAGVSEDSVAQSAISLASAGTPMEDPRLSHVGFYLIDEGRHRLAELLSCRESRRYRVLQWIYSHQADVYISAVLLITVAAVAAVVGLDIWAGERWLLLAIAAVIALLPANQLTVQVVNYLVIRILPPRLLPKMSFEKGGVPDEFRTLVVVPMLLINKKSVRDEVEKLEIRYLANPDANLLFSLFSDFADADEVHKEEDAELLQLAIEGLEALNQRYGTKRFYLFHRNRLWTESEQAFIGWERKRGKLEMLNGLLNGEPHPKIPSYHGTPRGA